MLIFWSSLLEICNGKAKVVFSLKRNNASLLCAKDYLEIAFEFSFCFGMVFD
jgi:hypothetical protein